MEEIVVEFGGSSEGSLRRTTTERVWTWGGQNPVTQRSVLTSYSIFSKKTVSCRTVQFFSDRTGLQNQTPPVESVVWIRMVRGRLAAHASWETSAAFRDNVDPPGFS